MPHCAPFDRLFLYFSQDGFWIMFACSFNVYGSSARISADRNLMHIYLLLNSVRLELRSASEFSWSKLIWVGLNSNLIWLMWSTASEPGLRVVWNELHTITQHAMWLVLCKVILLWLVHFTYFTYTGMKVELLLSDHPKKHRWSFMGDGCLQELRPYWAKIFPHQHNYEK